MDTVNTEGEKRGKQRQVQTPLFECMTLIQWQVSVMFQRKHRFGMKVSIK